MQDEQRFSAGSSGKFRKRKFSVTNEFLAKDRRELTTYFAIAFKPMLCDGAFKNKRFGRP
jgi:hypothetical protein